MIFLVFSSLELIFCYKIASFVLYKMFATFDSYYGSKSPLREGALWPLDTDFFLEVDLFDRFDFELVC